MIGASARVTLDVVARRDEVAAFAASLGATGERWPTTYPIRWLTDPAVVTEVKRLAADKPQSLPVHEMQTVETLETPPFDLPLKLTAGITRTDAIHIAVEAELSRDGRPLARLSTLLRLVP